MHIRGTNGLSSSTSASGMLRAAHVKRGTQSFHGGRRGVLMREMVGKTVGNQRIVACRRIVRQFGAQSVPLGSTSHSISNHHWARCEGPVRLWVWERVMHTPEDKRLERRVLFQRCRQRLGPLIADLFACTSKRFNKKETRHFPLILWLTGFHFFSAGDHHHLFR